jgi:hypothetical protein
VKGQVPNLDVVLHLVQDFIRSKVDRVEFVRLVLVTVQAQEHEVTLLVAVLELVDRRTFGNQLVLVPSCGSRKSLQGVV